jgi:hypothetical protein
MKPFLAPLSAALQHLQQATAWFMQNAPKRPDNAAPQPTICICSVSSCSA